MNYLVGSVRMPGRWAGCESIRPRPGAPHYAYAIGPRPAIASTSCTTCPLGPHPTPSRTTRAPLTCWPRGSRSPPAPCPGGRPHQGHPRSRQLSAWARPPSPSGHPWPAEGSARACGSSARWAHISHKRPSMAGQQSAAWAISQVGTHQSINHRFKGWLGGRGVGNQPGGHTSAFSTGARGS